MSAAVTEQTEKAFQKQTGVFLGRERLLGKKKSKGTLRFWKNIGLGYRTPKEAIEGTYVDKKCPFTSNVSIRGRILKGVVKAHRMKNTIVIRRDFLHYISKYNRFEKRHTNIAAHLSPAFRVNEGDNVTLGQCRPLSKTVRFNVIKVDAKAGGAKGVKLFNKF
jgi:small subunit ribosomal protein S11e